jgi:predicted signal transduction protein with EAL and GGDEF domain
VAEKIRTQLAAPYAVDDGTIAVMASIGTAVYPVDGQDYGALMRQSDIGMYRAKGRSSAPPRLKPATQSQPSPDGIG